VLDQYKNKLKLIIKNYPSDGSEFSTMAAAAALSAHKQNKFWEYHEKLFDNIDTFDRGTIRLIAMELHLDMEKFDADMQSPEIQGVIQRDIQEGLNAGIAGIPAVFVNGKRLDHPTLQEFQLMIDAELNNKSGPYAGAGSSKPPK
jgi:protein-disulfide isomerase